MAVLLGSLIGYERRSGDRPAGIRTMSLVSLGSALFTINSTYAFLAGPMVSVVPVGVKKEKHFMERHPSRTIHSPGRYDCFNC